jgi:hypothetical protein
VLEALPLPPKKKDRPIQMRPGCVGNTTCYVRICRKDTCGRYLYNEYSIVYAALLNIIQFIVSQKTSRWPFCAFGRLQRVNWIWRLLGVTDLLKCQYVSRLFQFSIGNFLHFFACLNFLCCSVTLWHSVTHVMGVTLLSCVTFVTNTNVMCHLSTNVSYETF